MNAIEQLNMISNVRKSLAKVSIIKNDTRSVLNALDELKNDPNKDYIFEHVMFNFLRYKDQTTVDYVTLESLDLGYKPKRQLYCNVIILSKEEKEKRRNEISEQFHKLHLLQLSTDRQLPKGY